MTANGWLQIAFFLLAVLAVTKPLGVFITKIFNKERTFLDPLLRPIERAIYRLCSVDESQEMRWTEYGTAMLLFSAISMLLLYLLERTQSWLAFNPQHLANIGPTSHGIPPRPSPPTPTGSRTSRKPRCRTSRKWQASPITILRPQVWASRS
jgi:hypothetical protein